MKQNVKYFLQVQGMAPVGYFLNNNYYDFIPVLNKNAYVSGTTVFNLSDNSINGEINGLTYTRAEDNQVFVLTEELNT